MGGRGGRLGGERGVGRVDSRGRGREENNNSTLKIINLN